MNPNLEMAAYAVGGFLLPGVVATTVMNKAPDTNAKLRDGLGKIGLVSLVAGGLATLMMSPKTQAAGMGVALGGALISLSALRVPNDQNKPLVMGNFDPLIASMHLGATSLGPSKG